MNLYLNKPLRLVLVVLLLTSLGVTSAASFGNCTASGNTFYCPSNCGGSYVEDCLSCDGYMSSDQDHNICIDRRLFQPHNTDPENHDDHYHYLWNDLVGAVVWFFTAGIAIACGVGGGGIYVPLGILLLQLAPKQSSGLSQASIFGASLAGLILNSRNKHPVETIRHEAGVLEGTRPLAKQKELSKAEAQQYLEKGGKHYTRPVINYDMALFMSPMQMAGAVLGVLVQRVLPNWLYLLTAACVLSYTSYRTYKKYFSARKVEKEKLEASKCQAKKEVLSTQETDSSGPVVEEGEDVALEEASNDAPKEQQSCAEEESISTVDEEAPPSSVQMNGEIVEEIGRDTTDQDDSLELRIQFLEEDMRQYPLEKIGALVLLWIGLFVLTLLQGGKGVESLLGIQCDSPWYYVMISIQFLWLFCFAAYFGRRLMKDQEARAAVAYPYLGEEDPVWDAPSIRYYGAFCFLSGVVAALIGIGGGMVLGPMMLVMGIDPRVSTATNSTMIVVTSSSIAIMFVTSGMVPWSYAVFYFCVTFAGAWLGKSQIDGYVKRTGKASMLIFILASIIAFATIGCFVIFITRLSAKGWCFDDFRPFCTTSEEDENCPVDRMLAFMNPM
ncbi:Sulfite exporter TauE/SafE family protein [Seminavis robusta]|uniref:Sulfite exporter TauE/SafE family protein n=1 Tax=Seminavis robusta TaxID=568900 RepID=A0A9N8E5W4_9STRA|nr:Sulfite exporter TauE/SafE family protein [Seminavis robusta]|eukprot:Sro548_g164400.1 Sulfite exporter TauE/SafE family protein (612) ;mRNA; r:27946-30066